MYVDYLLKSCETLNEAIDIILGSKTILKFRGFNLTKYVSNYQDILNQMPSEDLALINYIR